MWETPLISVLPFAANPANTNDIPPLKSFAMREEPDSKLENDDHKELVHQIRYQIKGS